MESEALANVARRRAGRAATSERLLGQLRQSVQQSRLAVAAIDHYDQKISIEYDLSDFAPPFSKNLHRVDLRQRFQPLRLAQHPDLRFQLTGCYKLPARILQPQDLRSTRRLANTTGSMLSLLEGALPGVRSSCAKRSSAALRPTFSRGC